ncbi:hypothetical protein HYQ44_002417 [Verticillium longisporum]|nr:hypothetical protein HYQ44_002417 [Verticillium longisporum]
MGKKACTLFSTSPPSNLTTYTDDSPLPAAEAPLHWLGYLLSVTTYLAYGADWRGMWHGTEWAWSII